MQCWTSDSFIVFLLVKSPCYNKLPNTDNLKLASNLIRLALDFLSMLLLIVIQR